MSTKKEVKKLKTKNKKALVVSDVVEGGSKKLRNKETNMICFVFIGLFAMMIIYLCVFNIKDAPKIINNPYNKRIDNQADKVVRGSIYAAGGETLAVTETDEDGNEYRKYPYGSLFSHTVGFSAKIKTGMEQSQNYYLLSETDNIFNQIANDISGQKAKGHNVYTTLNVELQEMAYRALGENKGAVIAMEPFTGKILAMVSKPAFDPNNALSDYEEWIHYESGESVLLNRATQGLYPPGSTFKIMTLLSYIRENRETYRNYSYDCNGSDYEEGGTTIPCFDSTSHGKQDLVKAFGNSCNAAFSNIGVQLNKQEFRKLCSVFLFNSSLPVDFEYSESLFALDENSGVSECQETAIGQGKTMVSPLHNLMITAAIANGGVMMKPYMVDHIEDAYQRVVSQTRQEQIAELMTAEETDFLTECMEEVIDSGTGYSMRAASYNAAGKTGSAQYDSSDNYHSWFVGFAPADNPQIAVCVILEGGYSNVGSAQYIAKDIFDAYIN